MTSAVWLVMTSKKTLMPRACALAISSLSCSLVPKCGSTWVKSVIQYPWYPAEASAPLPCTGLFLKIGAIQIAVVPRFWM